MANTKSAKKAIRVSQRKAVFNKARDVKIHDALKAVRLMAEKGSNKKEAMTAMSKLQQTLDKAVKSKSLHRNTASRLKANASKALKKTTK